jgi:hypothetical protein
LLFYGGPNKPKENYQEAIDSAFKISVTRGIGKYNNSGCVYACFVHKIHNALAGVKEKTKLRNGLYNIRWGLFGGKRNAIQSIIPGWRLCKLP